jgi:DNA-binding transcriptional MerR regulator
VDLTIDELASAMGTTTRTIRSLQTTGLLEHPELRGRTGIYRAHHLSRLRDILRLQAQGFSLHSLVILFAAHERGASLREVLGLGAPATSRDESREADTAELYSFAQLQSAGPRRVPGPRRALRSVVPTTMWEQTEAS